MRRHSFSRLSIGLFVFSVSAVAAPAARAQTVLSASSGEIYAAADVDLGATLIDDGTRPLYPAALRPLALNARVLAEFVVDTAGLVDTTSITTDDAAHPLFIAAVRTALAKMHFTVAQKGGHKVAQIVDESFVFKADDPPPVNVDSLVKAAPDNRTMGVAVYAPGTILPKYPPRAQQYDFNGEVDVEFVIDTLGRAEESTINITAVKVTQDFRSAPNDGRGITLPYGQAEATQDFREAVRWAIPRMKFVPALVGGRKVPQQVSQPFTFTIEH